MPKIIIAMITKIINPPENISKSAGEFKIEAWNAKLSSQVSFVLLTGSAFPVSLLFVMAFSAPFFAPEEPQSLILNSIVFWSNNARFFQ